MPSGASTARLTYEWWGVNDHLDESRYRESVKVAIDTVDNILQPIARTRIDFILVETNGSELEVVQGMGQVLSIVDRLAVRGHVMRDGVPIYKDIDCFLRTMGFATKVTTEGMVLARRRNDKDTASTPA